jgi:hypothetical protein
MLLLLLGNYRGNSFEKSTKLAMNRSVNSVLGTEGQWTSVAVIH